jgi:hypothetical protein
MRFVAIYPCNIPFSDEATKHFCKSFSINIADLDFPKIVKPNPTQAQHEFCLDFTRICDILRKLNTEYSICPNNGIK